MAFAQQHSIEGAAYIQRVAITLGIGPHSSDWCCMAVQVMSKFVDLQESKESSGRQAGSDSDNDSQLLSTDVDDLLRSTDVTEGNVTHSQQDNDMKRYMMQ